ncbi:MAG TPA: NADH:flavin oxidoreductase [Candidatus Binatia bacterium]|nr:NADH:flavin oxidoreductase [Candidatus Binatia bacterium]
MTATLRLLTPARLGPVELRNRVVKAATYETRAAGGLVTEPLVAWHRTFAAGGVAMTTLAYCAVAPEGRTFPDQIWMREEALPGLRRFAAAMHDEGARAAIQLAHAGWFADPRATGTRPLGPSPTFSAHARTWARAMDEDDIARVVAHFARAAALAVEAGFDALEVHVGHGYLLSQFLSPYNNRRRDRWGGSIENRARLPRDVLRAVRAAAGDRAAVYAKLNMDDGFPGGLVPADALAVARLLGADGTVDALQLTGGHTGKTPMYLMRGESPLPALFARDPSLVRRTALRVLGRLMFRNWPFEEAFFAPDARRFLAAVATPLMLLGGLNRLASMEAAIAEGFAFVALGRALIRRPDLVNAFAAGRAEESGCTHCNACVAAMGYEPTTCVLRDAPS